MIANNNKISQMIMKYINYQYQYLMKTSNLCRKRFQDIASIMSGTRSPNISKDYTSHFHYPVIGASNTIGYSKSFNYDDELVTIGRVGTLGIVQYFQERFWASDNVLVIKSDFPLFICELLREFDFEIIRKGTTQPLITKTDLSRYIFSLPIDEDIWNFETKYKSLHKFANEKKRENEVLKKLKSYLLMKYFD